jgi:peptide-methionine (S)-S-oxide reductase
MIDEHEALPGRSSPLAVPSAHATLGTTMFPPFPEGLEVAYVAMGCFWGAERTFFTTPGVYTTAVGYMGGFTPNPTYDEVCSGRTGHAEAVMVVFDPSIVSYEGIVASFYEHHDPTQGFRQGNDVGTQYRSGLWWTTPEQEATAKAVTERYAEQLSAAGLGEITTELGPAGPFFYAEGYHQQYLAKNPNGYCGLGGTGVSCPVGILGDDASS